MNSKTLLTIGLVILCLFGFGLYFSTVSKDKELAQAQEAKLAEMEQQLTQIEKENQDAQEEMMRQTKMAAEAKRMAEAKAAEETAAKQRLVDELNARLQREAMERKQAEIAQQELEAKLKALEAAQQEAADRLAALASEEEETGETSELRRQLESQKNQLASLEQENEQLKERQQVLLEQQIKTEESIMKAGGRIDLPYPEIRSPNYKRREALYFKERISGSGN